MFLPQRTGQSNHLIAKRDEFQGTLADRHSNVCPATNGVFERPLPVEKISEIGGQPDDNVTITRRMLLLLEDEWLFNEEAFRNVRRILLQKYRHDSPGEDKICLFLLNDIIRYRRTLCVDLELKTHTKDKAREVRLIKLRFSGMLLYVSGVLAVGQGFGLSSVERLADLEKQFRKYPIERIQSIVADTGLETLALDPYAEFLRTLDTASDREALEQNGPKSSVFRDMSVTAGQFRDELHLLLRNHFREENPTIRAILR